MICMSGLKTKHSIEGTVAKEESGPDFPVFIQMDLDLIVTELLWIHSEHTMEVGVENGSP